MSQRKHTKTTKKPLKTIRSCAFNLLFSGPSLVKVSVMIQACGSYPDTIVRQAFPVAELPPTGFPFVLYVKLFVTILSSFMRIS
ncbi:hypothetical protein V8F06_007297 [Rhypophila decipiens]